MFNPEVVVFDMDGTLLNENNQICSETKDMLSQLVKKKILMVATGRTLKEVVEVTDLHYFHTLICSNGMAIYNGNKEPVRLIQLSSPLAIDVVKEAGKKELYYEVHSEQGNRYVREEDFSYIRESVEGRAPSWVHPSEWKSRQEAIHKLQVVSEKEYQTLFQDIVKVYFFSKDPKAIKEWRDWLVTKSKHTPFALSNSSPNNCEINSFGINKGEALQFVLKELNIDSSRVMAFGDGMNDVELFHQVGWKVAMKNAAQELKEIADDITEETNKHAAVVKYIKKYVLAQEIN